ncbi:MAG: DUF1631 family protein, partial [Aquabacterium sp.]
SRIQSAAQAAAAQVVEMLGLASMSATSNAQRQAFTAAQFDLRHKMTAFNQTFSRVLYEKVTGDLRKSPNDSGRGSSQTDWQSLSLVDESEMEGQVLADRLATDMAQECEWELRELAGYVLPMLDEAVDAAARGDVERNPLRPKNVGRALYQAVEATSQETEVRKLLAKEIGRTLGQSLRGCYQAVIEDLRQRGVQPAGLAARPSSAAGLGRAGGPAGAAEAAAKAAHAMQPGAPRSEAQMARTLGAMFGMNVPAGYSSSTAGLDTGASAAGAFAHTGAGGGGYGGGPTGAAADAAMLDVIKRLAFLSAQGGDAANWSVSAPGGFPASGGGAPAGGDGTTAAGSTGMGSLGGLMAVNLIRAHREELMRATGAPLDHMVIDVVAALFDQVLSDPKVPPQMARLIARLQLPVLRVALKDMNFFSSRKHPVRRFVNRIASLAASFDDFDEGPGQECLKRVTDLVGEIVDGDFDQMANYEAKLAELEAFIRDQTAKDAEEHADVAAVLVGKEADLRIQQRYMRALQTQLSSLSVDDFLRDFLSQVWSQVQVLAQAREGNDSPFVQRVKRVPRELILSVQPKGTPQLRKDFLVRLPQLMKDLNDGLTLIRWPEDAKKEFFSKLLPSHAESLKNAPPTDFVRRQLDFQLDQIDKVAIPSREDVAGEAASASSVMLSETPAVADLSPQEAEKVGLVDEQAIDWSGEVDIDLGEPVVNTADVDINLDSPPQPSAGPQLINHIQPGVAYQMYLNDSWKKVRLSWVSPGRTFFIFTYGRMYKQTISLTGRTLVKMCEGNRFRAYEQAELIERATARARKQLAALSASVATKQ